jgi:glycoside/pentoside/hexuronide:cation symporter, GPH family
MAFMAIVPPNSLLVLLALQIGLQLSFGPTIPVLWAMMADVADYSEWRTGRRSTALAFASIIFGLKLGLGIGAWLNGEVLRYFNYSAGESFAPSASRGIVFTVTLFPAAALVTAAAVSMFYPLNEKVMFQVEEALRVRRSAP